MVFLKLFALLFLPCVLSAGILSASSLCLPFSSSLQSKNDIVDTLVVGSGLSGASAAFYLNNAGLNIKVADSADCVGGIVATNSGHGFQWEEGPNSFQPNIAILRFLKDLQLLDELVLADPQLPRFVYFKNKLHKLPMKMMDIPSFSLLSLSAKIRAALGFLGFVDTKPKDHEESIKEFAIRHLGSEVFERMVDPFVSGVYAGNPAELTMKAAMKKIYAMEQLSSNRGMLSGFVNRMKQVASEKASVSEANADLPAIPSGSLGSLQRGMQRMPQRVRELLGEQRVLLRHRLVDVNREGDLFVSTFEVGDSEAGDGGDNDHKTIKVIRSKSLLLTTPAYVTSPLLKEHLLPGVAAALESIYYPPIAAVVSAYPETAFKMPLDGFGHLIPRSAGVRTLGNIWASSLFPGRSPPGFCLISQFIGGAQDPSVTLLTDEELVQTAHQDNLRTFLKPDAPAPQVMAVKRWLRSIPQYERGHVEKVEGIHAQVKTQPGLFVGGNYMTGVAVGDCIQYGMDVAKEVQSYLATRSA